MLAQEEARLLNHNYIGTEHLLLGLVREGEGVAALTLREFGVELEAVRDSVIERMGGRGAGRRRPAEARGEARAAGPVCPDCHRALAEGVLLRPVTVRTEDPSGEERQVIVIYCEVCGRTFGVLPA